MPAPPITADDFTHFQDLFRRMASELKIALEEVLETEHQLTDILQKSSSSEIALPINGAIMEPTKTIRQTPATISPMCKRADRKYYVPSKGSEFLFTYLAPNLLVVEAANQRSKQQHFWSMPFDKESKRLDLFGCKVHSSSKLQFKMANYVALLAKYDDRNYGKFMNFINEITEEQRQQFKLLVSKGQRIAHMALQASLDVADMVARSTTVAVVM